MHGAFATDAQRYYAAGVNVLPILRGTKRPPDGVTWRRWQTHRQTDEDLGRLIEVHPQAEIAIITGGPGCCVDIESDSRRGERVLRTFLDTHTLPMPATACFSSPRGLHRLYRAGRTLPSRLRLCPDLDVLARGRYVVVPHSRGRRWLLCDLHDMAPLPQEWEAVLLRARRPLTGPALLDVERDGVEAGVRNVTMAALVGAWLTRGMPEADILRRAAAWARRCVPPLPEAEAEQVVASVLRGRRQARSPEREALLLARDHRLRPTDRLTFVGLVALHGDLGLTAPMLATPHRFLAQCLGVHRDSVGPSLRRLEQAGLIALSTRRDPWGRPVTFVTFTVGNGGT